MSNWTKPIRQWVNRLRVNSSRVYLEAFAREAAQSVAVGSRVLDAGAGDCPYRGFFKHTEYESADFCQVEGSLYGEITYICDLGSIPVEDNRYDLVLCTQVMEHLPEPDVVLQELFRVLKPGGTIWVSAPLFYPEHQIPYDFYRYTQYGMKHKLEHAGFSIQRSQWLEGYYGTLSFQLESAAVGLPVRPGAYGAGATGCFASFLALWVKPLFLLLSLIFSRLDLHAKNTQSGLCKNYAVVAVKSQG